MDRGNNWGMQPIDARDQLNPVAIRPSGFHKAYQDSLALDCVFDTT